MKKLLLIFAALFHFASIQGQDIPLFSQKLTNSFMYNPALAGNTAGSFVLSHRINYSGVKGAPVDNYLSVQTPFSNYRFGVGLNVYQEEVNVLKSTYYSAAFAYHIHFNRFSSFSMGVSGEYNTLRLSTSADPGLMDDLTLQKYANGQNSPDFSAGIAFQNRFVKIGASANRLATTWIRPADSKVVSNYYSGFVQGIIPLRASQDLLEPYFSYRRTATLSNVWDLGLYYTYGNKVTAGAATRNGNIYSGTLAYRINKTILVGFSHEIISGAVAGFTGSSNEFTLRFDFKDKTYRPNYRDDFTSSIAYRRKVLNTASPGKSAGSRSPQQLKKSKKKAGAYSPNSRYDKAPGSSSTTSKATSTIRKNNSKKYQLKRKKNRKRF